MGDAACAFNPIYGQGMSIAAMEALDLQSELQFQQELNPDGDVGGLAQRFATRLAASITYAWDAACRADFGVPGVEGSPPDGYLDDLAYYDRVVALSRDDLSVYEKLSLTNQLLCSPEWMHEPELRRRIDELWDDLGAIMGYPPSR